MCKSTCDYCWTNTNQVRSLKRPTVCYLQVNICLISVTNQSAFLIWNKATVGTLQYSIWKWNFGWFPLGWSRSGSVFQDHPDHGASKEYGLICRISYHDIRHEIAAEFQSNKKKMDNWTQSNALFLNSLWFRFCKTGVEKQLVFLEDRLIINLKPLRKVLQTYVKQDCTWEVTKTNNTQLKYQNC